MTDELKQWEYDRGYDKGKADMLKEIEDIKQEIAEIEYLGCPQPEVVIKDILEIIDNHIGEVSGCK